MVWLADARAPDGMRLYAVGDVHGCIDALAEVHHAIEADLAARPPIDWRLIHLGDYVDRGADSRRVIDFLCARMADEPRVLCLRGNHDEMFARSIEGDPRHSELWLRNGGGETLESYGVGVVGFLETMRAGGAAGAAGDAIPAEHRRFLDGLAMSVRLGDYYFVHAGIDPARPLDAQAPAEQLWVREPFLNSDRQFEAVIVHGHTPAPRVVTRRNRIGIDTGAVFGGPLTCLVLEGATKELLSGRRRVPLPLPR